MSLTNEEIREFTLMALDQPPVCIGQGLSPAAQFTVNDPWWVDYRGWIYDRSGNYLRIRDGLTGEVIDMSEPCVGRSTSYAIKIFDNVLGYCIIRESNEDNYQTWKFRYYDGTVSDPIKLPFIAVSSGIYFTTYYEPFWGYSDGILAISQTGKNNQNCWTYTKTGEFLYKTVALSGGVRWPCIEHICPLSWNTVGVIKSGSNFAESFYWDSYSVLSDTVTHYNDNKPLFDDYYPTFPSGVNKNKQVTYLGEDDNYFYAAARMYDSSGSTTGEWVVAKFNRYNFSGPKEIARYRGDRTWKYVSQSKMISYSETKYSNRNITYTALRYFYLTTQDGTNIYDQNENPFENGSIVVNTGADTTSSTCIRTNGYIPVTPGEIYQATSNIERAYFYFYNSSYTYLRGKSIGWETLSKYVTVPSGASYVRVVLSRPETEYWTRLLNLQTFTKYFNGRFDMKRSTSTYYGAFDNQTYLWINQSGVFKK